jgi:anti-sigma factor RsiW
MSRPEAKLSCRRAQVLLEAYVDGDLRGPRRAAMDTHLAGCHTCSQEFLRARQVRGALRDLPPQACSEAVLDSVRRRLGAAAAAMPPVAPPVAAGAAPNPAAARPASPSWDRRLAGWWSGHAPGWRPVTAFGSLAVVAVAAFLILHRPQHEQPVTAEDLRRADAQVRWVLATLGQINQRTSERVRTEVFEKGVAEPTMRAVNGALENSVPQ